MAATTLRSWRTSAGTEAQTFLNISAIAEGFISGLLYAWLDDGVFSTRHIGGDMRGEACFSILSACRVWLPGKEAVGEVEELPEVDLTGSLHPEASGR
jgi:hypothetical protein